MEAEGKVTNRQGKRARVERREGCREGTRLVEVSDVLRGLGVGEPGVLLLLLGPHCLLSLYCPWQSAIFSSYRNS